MKLNSNFFKKNKVAPYSAANLFRFSVDILDTDIFDQFETIATKKEIQLPDNSEELQHIAKLSSAEEIVNYMRKIKSMGNAPHLINKAITCENETMPLVLTKYLTNATDIFIETAGKCFVKADIKYAYELRQQYDNIRSSYAKAVACLVFGLKEMHEEKDFLYEEYTKMKSQYSDESLSDFPLLALHLLCDV